MKKIILLFLLLFFLCGHHFNVHPQGILMPVVYTQSTDVEIESFEDDVLCQNVKYVYSLFLALRSGAYAFSYINPIRVMASKPPKHLS